MKFTFQVGIKVVLYFLKNEADIFLSRSLEYIKVTFIGGNKIFTIYFLPGLCDTSQGVSVVPAIVSFCQGRKKITRPSEVSGSRSPQPSGLLRKK